MPRLGSRKSSSWWPVLFFIGAGCVDLAPPWQQSRRDASDVAIVPPSDAGSENTGGTVERDADGAGGLAVDGLTASGGMGGEVGPPASDSELDVPGGDTPVILDSEPVDSVDTPSTIDGGSDGTLDLPLERDSTDSTAPRDTRSDGRDGRNDAQGQDGATSSGGATGSGGTTANGTGGSGAGGATLVDAAANVCTGYQGVDGGAAPGGLPQGLIAYYPCEQASNGATLPDLSGNSKNATLASSGTGATVGYNFAAGQVNNALLLTKASEGHVVLPAGILAGACEMTVATWVYINSQSVWQRIWDFGQASKDSSDPTVYMFLTTSNDALKPVPRFAISTTGYMHEDRVDGDAALTTGAWQHIAVVVGPAGGVLYVNGVKVGTNSSMTLRPADLGNMPDNYIGRSQFTKDPYLDGNIDDFRVYNRALSADEIKTLFTYTGS